MDTDEIIDSDSEKEVEEQDASATGVRCDTIICTVVKLQKDVSLEDFISLVYQNLKESVVIKDLLPADKKKMRTIVRDYKPIDLPSNIQMCLHNRKTSCGKFVPILITKYSNQELARKVRETLSEHTEIDQDLIVLAGIFEYLIPHLRDCDDDYDDDDTEIDDTDKLLSLFFKDGVTCFVSSTWLSYGRENDEALERHRENVRPWMVYLSDETKYGQYLVIEEKTKWVQSC